MYKGAGFFYPPALVPAGHYLCPHPDILNSTAMALEDLVRSVIYVEFLKY